MDKDSSPIGGVKYPMRPTKQLWIVTVLMNLLAVLLSFFISFVFAVGIFFYIVASLAYSYRKIRLKQYPVIGYLTVIIFQGALTFFLVYQGCGIHNTIQTPVIGMVAASLLIGGFYPLTQIYQHEEDKKDGVVTISYLLGYGGTFIFTGIVYALGFITLAWMFYLENEMLNFLILQTFMLPVLVYFFVWFGKVMKDKKQADFKHAMQMNLLASVCTNLGFITLLILK